jgi:hypothetical protein
MTVGAKRRILAASVVSGGRFLSVLMGLPFNVIAKLKTSASAQNLIGGFIKDILIHFPRQILFHSYGVHRLEA